MSDAIASVLLAAPELSLTICISVWPRAREGVREIAAASQHPVAGAE